MSILIKGMEMPTSCHECVAGFGGGCYFGTSADDYMCPDTGRADWCPLVPVQPHGRLIEDTAVQEQIDEWLGTVGDVVIGHGLSYYGELIGCIADAPTIIPAEPCKEKGE